MLLFFSRPLHGLGLTFRCYPAINRWAIFSRPLTRIERSALFVQSPCVSSPASIFFHCLSLKFHRSLFASKLQCDYVIFFMITSISCPFFARLRVEATCRRQNASHSHRRVYTSVQESDTPDTVRLGSPNFQ